MSLRDDIQAYLDKDPAARFTWQVVLLYPGFQALLVYRLAHWLHLKGFFFLPHFLAYLVRIITSIEIHPAAKIGRRLVIDHGVGVVIGETATVGNDVTMYQGVVLGGTGKDRGKRHPDIEDGVFLSAGCKILGPVRVGKNAKVGAGAVVLKDVPPGCTAVGVPARILDRGERNDDI